MDNIVSKLEEVDLSGKDIERICNNQVKILPYEALMNIKTVDDFFKPYDSVALLYQTKQNYGHWVAVIRRSNKLVEFYDPYGIAIDTELQLSDYNLRNMGGVLTPHLSALLKSENYKVISNTTQLQKVKEHINTCGRYVALRILLKDKPLNSFNDLLSKNKCYDSDFWVSVLTFLL